LEDQMGKGSLSLSFPFDLPLDSDFDI
jgi:hypothetical protein